MQSALLENSTQGSTTEHRGIFARICNFITSGTEKVGDIGDGLITSAQKDLYNLKSELMSSWAMSQAERDTIALYTTAIISRILYTPVLLGTTLITSVFKLAVGSVCMILGLRLFTLCSRLFNTLWEVVKQGCEVVSTLFKQLFTNILNFMTNVAQKFCDICARIAASIIRNVIWACQKLKIAFDFVWEQIAAAVRCIYTAFKDLFTFIATIVENIFFAVCDTANAVFSLANGGINAIAVLVTAIVMGFGALFFETGASNIIAGIAKMVFTLNEGLATTVGVILDGVHDCGDNLILALRSLVGYRPIAQAAQQPLLRDVSRDEVDVEASNLPTLETPIVSSKHPGLFFVGPCEVNNKSCRKSLHGAAHNFNTSISDLGWRLQENYVSSRRDLFAGYDEKRTDAREEATLADGLPRLFI